MSFKTDVAANVVANALIYVVVAVGGLVVTPATRLIVARTGQPWYFALGWVLLIIALLLWGAIEWRRRMVARTASPPTTQPEGPYPTVRIFRHKEGRKHNDEVFHQVFDFFEKAGWRVEGGSTDLPQHENGIRIAGKAGYDLEAVKWGLTVLGIEPVVDARPNPPEVLEVIVGRYDGRANDMLADARKALAQPQTSPAVPDWLLAVAENDIGNAQTFLYMPRETIYTRPALTAPEPYVDFWFGVINATVYEMTVTGKGRFFYLQHPLSTEPSALNDAQMIIRHGDYNQFAFRQWIRPEVANAILAGPVRHFTAGSFVLMFRFVDSAGKEHSVEKSFGDSFHIQV